MASLETAGRIPGYTIEQSFEAAKRVRELAGRFELALMRRSTEAGVASGDFKLTSAHVDAAVEQAAKDILSDAEWLESPRDA